MNESVQWLYGKLTGYGYNVGTEEQFEQLMRENEESRAWAYDKASAMGLNVGDYGSFERLMGVSANEGDQEESLSTREERREQRRANRAAEASMGVKTTSDGRVVVDEDEQEMRDARKAYYDEIGYEDALERAKQDKKKEGRAAFFKSLLAAGAAAEGPMYSPTAADDVMAHVRERRDARADVRTLNEAIEGAEEGLDVDAMAQSVGAPAVAEVQHRAEVRERMQEDGTIDRMKEMRKEARKEKRQARRAAMASAAMMAEGFAPMGTDERVMEQSREWSQNKLMAQTLDEALDKADAGEIDGVGKEVRQGLNAFWDSALRAATWDFGASDALNGVTLYSIIKKWEEDPESLTATEQKVLDALGMATAVEEAYRDQLGVGYGVGESLPVSMGFMASMALNPASGFGKALSRQAVRRYGRNSVMKNVARLAGDVDEVIAMTFTTGGGRVVADAMERINGRATYDIDPETGMIEYGGQKDQVAVADAFLKAIVSNYIENYTETIGNYMNFDPLYGMMKGVAAKGLRKVNLNKWADALTDVSPAAMTSKMRGFKEMVKFDGVLGEIMEEEIGMAMNALFVGDNKWSDFLDAETQLTTIMSCTIMSAVLNGYGGYQQGRVRRQYEKNVEDREREAQRLLGDKFADLRDRIDLNSPEGVVDALNEVYQSQDYTLEQKRALANYASARVGMQYYNESEAKARRGLLKEEQQWRDAYEAGRAAQLPAYYNIDKEYRAAEAAINERENAEEMWDAIAAINRAPAGEVENILNGFSEEDKQLINNRRYNAARWSGAINHRAEQVQDLVDEYAGQVTPYVQPDGTVTTAIYGDRVVYVSNRTEKTATIWTHDGARKEMVPIGELEHVQTHNAEELIERFRNEVTPAVEEETDRYMEYPAEVQEPAQGVTVETLDGKQWQVAATDGENVEIVGLVFDKKSGQWIPNSGDYRKMTREQFMDWQKAELDRKKANTYEQGDELIFYVNGEPIDAEITGIDPEGNYMVQISHLADGLNKAVSDVYTAEELRKLTTPSSKVSEETAENESTPTEEIKQSVSEEVTNSQIGENVTEPIAEVAEDVNTPQAKAAELLAELEEDEVDENVAYNAQKALDAAEKTRKAKPTMKDADGDVAAFKALKSQWQAELDEAQREVLFWDNVAKEVQRQREARMSEQVAMPAQAPVAETVEAPSVSPIAEADPVAKPKRANRQRQTVSFDEFGDAAMDAANEILQDRTPQNGEELVAWMLTGPKGIRLIPESFRYHTGYSKSEQRKLFQIMAKKENGGVTMERFGELVMLADREDGTNFFDQSDANAGLNAVLELLSQVETIGDINNYILRNREEMAYREASAVQAAEDAAMQEAKDAWYMDQYHATEEELAAYNEYLAEFAEEIYGEDADYEQRIATFAEIQLEYDNQGTDAGLRSSADQGEGLASDREGGRSVGETEQLDRREVLADAAGVAEAEDGRAGGSVSTESDVDSQEGKRKVTANYFEMAEEAQRKRKAAEAKPRKRPQGFGKPKKSASELYAEEKQKVSTWNNAYSNVIVSSETAEDAIAEFRRLAAKARERAEDWRSREYKKNNTVVTGQSRTSGADEYETTIGAANERRRQGQIRSALNEAEEYERYALTIAERVGIEDNEKKNKNDEEGQEPEAREARLRGNVRGKVVQSLERKIREYEERTGWTKGFTKRQREILEDLRNATDNELINTRNRAMAENESDVLDVLNRYARSGERLWLLGEWGITLNEPVSLSKIDELFGLFNRDAEMAALYARVLPIIEQISPTFSFETIRDKDGNVEDDVAGRYSLKSNRIRLNKHLLNSTYTSDVDKARAIVHEMLHAVAQYAVDAKERMNKGEDVGIKIDEGLLEAAQSLIDVYEQIKDNKALKGEYGTTDVHEMISEFSKPIFRDKLKKIYIGERSAWQKIKDFFYRIIKKDMKGSSVYAQAKNALDYLIDNFDGNAYVKSRGLSSGTKEMFVGERGASEDNIRFRNGDNQDAAYMDAVERGDMETAQRMVDEVLEDAGYTIRGEHGTTHKFTIFNNINANIENSFGKGFYFTSDAYDAEQNYSHDEGPDLKNRIELLAERMEFEDAYEDMDYDERLEEARKRLSGGENIVISAAIRMENPCVFSIDPDGVYKETIFDVEEEYDEENDEYGEPTGLLVDFANALNEVLAEGDYWGADRIDASELIYDGYYSADQLKRKVGEMLMDITDEEGNLASAEIFRSALERMGFDGIIDNAPSLRFKNMGLSRDTKHYIAFSPNQIKQSDAVTYDNDGNIIPLSERANRANDDIRFRDGKEKSLETALLEDESSFKGTAVSSDDGAKVLKDIDNAISEYENKSTQTKNFIGDVARALGIDAEGKSSKYATFEAMNGDIVTIRISDHNATVSNFDNNGEENGVSIVVSRRPNEGITNDGDAHVVEFFYSDKKLKSSEDKPLVEILKSIKQTLYSGEYKDSTGLAEREEVNERLREGTGAVSDREVSYENDPIAKFMGKPRYYGKRAAAFAERERRRMAQAAEATAKTLGLDVEVVTDAATASQLTQQRMKRRPKAKGWYDVETGKIVVVVSNHVSAGDAVRTVLHEGVAHHGLRELFGDGFDAMLDNIYNNVAPELKARIDAIAERTGVSTQVATEEYLASLAEETNFEYAKRTGWWTKIKGYFMKMLRKLGMPGLTLREEITDNELRYLLWRSYQNLVDPNSYMKPLGYLDDVAKQKELKVGEYAENTMATPRAADIDAIEDIDDIEDAEAEEWAAVTMQRIEELEAQAVQLEKEIADMEADRDADDASRYEMWEQQIDPLREQLEDVYAEIEGLYSLEAEVEEMSMASEDAIRYRMSINEEEFDNTQREAVRNIGIVMPNLGDAEVNIVDVPRHDFTGTGREAISKAKEWANRELVGEHVANEGTKEEFKYSIDEKSVKKFLSGVSTSLSDNLGVHLSVLKKLPSVIDSSIEAEIHADYKKGEQRDANNGIEDENLLIHRLYGCAKINGELYRVKTTIKERKSAGVKPYTYEVTKIELLDGSSQEGTSSSDASSNSISGAKLLKGVEKSYDKGKFLLDESKRVSENSINSEEIISEVERESGALGVPVRIARSVDELPDEDTRKRAVDGKLKGYYDPRTNEVVLYAPNTDDANDAKRTILHEIVGHKGMRQLIGEERYDKAMVQLMYMLPSEVRDAVLRRAERHGWNAAIAMDEYLAEQAERDVQPTWWGKVNAMIRALLRNMGFNVMLTDADVTYLLWRSRKKLQGDTAFDMATDAILKQAARKSVDYNVESDNAIRYRGVEQGKKISEAVSDYYEKYTATTNADKFLGGVKYMATHLGDGGIRALLNDLSESQFEDIRSVRVLEEAIESAEGKPLRENEMVHKSLNAKTSRDARDMDKSQIRYFQPMAKLLGKILGKKIDGRKIEIDDVERYLICKHSPENNEFLMKRAHAENRRKKIHERAKELMKGTMTEEEAIAQATSEYTLHQSDFRDDYSGLTELFPDDMVRVAKIAERTEELTSNGVDEDTARQMASREFESYEPTLEDREKMAADEVARFEAAVDGLHEELWGIINGINRDTIERLFRSGLISRSLYNDLKKRHKFYVPLSGWKNDAAADIYNYAMYGFDGTPIQTVIKKAFGTKYQARNILGSMFAMNMAAITEGNQNLVKQKLYSLALNHDTGVLQIVDLWEVKDGEGDAAEWKPAPKPELRPTMSDAETQKALTDYQNKLMEMEKDGMARKAVNSLADNFGKHTTDKEAKRHHVELLVNGRKVVIWVNGNPKLAQAINGDLKVKKELLFFNDAVDKANRFLAQVQTSLNPEFMISNFERDILSASRYNLIKYGPKYEASFMKHLAQLMPIVSETNADMRSDVWGGAGIFNLFALDRNTNNPNRKPDAQVLDMNNPLHREFVNFLNYGGKTGYVERKQAEDLQQRIKKLSKREQSIIRKVPAEIAGWAVDTIEHLNEGIENATRFAAYLTARERGKSVTEAVFEAKEVSVNFNMQGSGAWGNASFRKLYNYFNVGLQSLRREKNLGREHPKAYIANLAFMMALGAISTVLLTADWDGDDEDEYMGLSDFNRYNYINVKTENGFIHYSLPQDLRAFYAIGCISTEWAMGKIDGSRAVQAYATQANNYTPLSFVSTTIDREPDSNPLKNLAMSFVPSAAVPVAEIAVNEDFLGRRINNQNQWNEYEPEWQRAGYRTPEWVINASKTLSEAGGGTEHKRGVWFTEINPSNAWHIMDSYGGGFLDFAQKTYNLVEREFAGKEHELRDYPMVSKFYVESGQDYSKQRVVNDRYRMYREDYETIDNELNGYLKDKNNELGKLFVRAEEEGLPESVVSKERAEIEKTYEDNVKRVKESPNYWIYESFVPYEKDYNSLDRDLREVRKYGSEQTEKELSGAMYNVRKKVVDEIDAKRSRPIDRVRQWLGN